MRIRMAFPNGRWNATSESGEWNYVEPYVYVQGGNAVVDYDTRTVQLCM